MKANVLLYIILLVVPISLIFIYYYTFCQHNTYYQNKEDFTVKQDVKFLSDKETRDFLSEDKDRYVRNMSMADLRARKVATPEEYIRRIISCNIKDVILSLDEMRFIIECTQYADNFLESYVYRNHIDGKDIAKIPWNIAIICDAYEEGLPHTRKDIIFLAKRHIKVYKEQLTSLLIHEKVHIYQRYNSEKMDKLIEAMGYTIAGYATDSKYILRRSNPDINNKIYYDKQSKKEIIFKYLSDTPEGINNVENANSIEHPFEQMAYEIANEYTRNYLKTIVSKL